LASDIAFKTNLGDVPPNDVFFNIDELILIDFIILLSILGSIDLKSSSDNSSREQFFFSARRIILPVIL